MNAILPGLMKTPMVEHSAGLAASYAAGDVEAMWRARDAQVPMGPWATPGTSPSGAVSGVRRTRYVTGHRAVVDGGFYAEGERSRWLLDVPYGSLPRVTRGGTISGSRRYWVPAQPCTLRAQLAPVEFFLEPVKRIVADLFGFTQPEIALPRGADGAAPQRVGRTVRRWRRRRRIALARNSIARYSSRRISASSDGSPSISSSAAR